MWRRAVAKLAGPSDKLSRQKNRNYPNGISTFREITHRHIKYMFPFCSRVAIEHNAARLLGERLGTLAP
jgi:hypothetical protein